MSASSLLTHSLAERQGPWQWHSGFLPLLVPVLFGYVIRPNIKRQVWVRWFPHTSACSMSCRGTSKPVLVPVTNIQIRQESLPMLRPRARPLLGPRRIQSYRMTITVHLVPVATAGWSNDSSASGSGFWSIRTNDLDVLLRTCYERRNLLAAFRCCHYQIRDVGRRPHAAHWDV